MIAAWMLYWIAIAVAFAVVGEALERALHLTGRATRWAWVAALAGSYLVPTAAWLRPSAFGALPVPLAQHAVAQSPQTVAAIVAPSGRAAAPTRSFRLDDLDTALGWAWQLSSALLLVALGAAAARLAAARRQWRTATVDGRTVLVSENVGPAVAGLWRPRVVLPEWALALTDRERCLILAHEDEHIRVGDPWLLAAAAAVVALAPWNLAVWWQLRRLRLAVEMDCDARVLARDVDTPAYGELLLRVGRRRARLPLGAPALGEPISFLGRRIRRMATPLPRWRWAGATVALGIAVAALATACEAPRPVPTGLRGDGEATSTSTPAPSGIADSVAWSLRDSTGSVIAAGTLPVAPNEKVLDALKLAHAIPRHDTLPVNIFLRAAGRVPTLTVFEGPPPAQFKGFVAQGDRVREVAQRYHPEAFVHPSPGAAVALVFDAQDRLIGHAAGVREPSDGDCLAVVDRLVPTFHNGKLSSSGCVDAGARGTLVIYWKKLKQAEGSGDVSIESTVDEPPVPLTGSPLQYPALLRNAGIQGRVMVRAVFDTTGRVEPSSVQIVESPHPGFDQAARNFALHSRILPHRVGGRAARVELTAPIYFSMRE